MQEAISDAGLEEGTHLLPKALPTIDYLQSKHPD